MGFIGTRSDLVDVISPAIFASAIKVLSTFMFFYIAPYADWVFIGAKNDPCDFKRTYFAIAVIPLSLRGLAFSEPEAICLYLTLLSYTTCIEGIKR